MAQSAVNGLTLPDNGNIDIGSGSADMAALVSAVRTMAGYVTVSAGTVDLSGDSGGVTSVAFGTTNGCKIGTGATQKIGFFNKTPVVLPAAAAQGALGGTLTGTTDDTLADVAGSWDATAIATINKNFKECQELINALRTGLVNLGLVKGAA
jgi:hypothetical protein